MKREPGYYWVKIKGDTSTKGDLDILMGLLSPVGKWVICYYSVLGWEYRHFDIDEHHFAEINEARILSPGEVDEDGWNEVLNEIKKELPFTLGTPLDEFIAVAMKKCNISIK